MPRVHVRSNADSKTARSYRYRTVGAAVVVTSDARELANGVVADPEHVWLEHALTNSSPCPAASLFPPCTAGGPVQAHEHVAREMRGVAVQLRPGCLTVAT
jgi:hypothetical protein